MKIKNEEELQRLINESDMIEVSGTQFAWWSLYDRPVEEEPWIALALSEEDLNLSEYQYEFRLEELLDGQVDGETLMVFQGQIPAVLYLRFHKLEPIKLKRFLGSARRAMKSAPVESPE